MSRAAFVVNPAKCDDIQALKSRAEAAMAANGWEEPLWYETTTEDPGTGQAEKALAEDAEVVYACGGDGTVTACAQALAGTNVPLTVMPLGTGNLLARNLALPTQLDEVLLAGLTGHDLVLDLGRIDDRKFVVMAGIGLAAEMMSDAPRPLKHRFGWAAYVLAFVRHLGQRGVPVEVRVDGDAPLKFRARTVVIGNLGRLQAGLALLPDAVPDDGRLDVVAIAPRSILDWLAVAGRVVLRRNRNDERLHHATGKEIAIRAARPMARQLDGEPIEDGAELVTRIEPAALTVRIPSKEKK